MNCRAIAGHAGERCPRGRQRLLSAAVWDEAGVGDDLRDYVLEHFADPSAVLVADETGDLTAGAVYGQDPQLRAGLARRGLGYVLAAALRRTRRQRAPLV